MFISVAEHKHADKNDKGDNDRSKSDEKKVVINPDPIVFWIVTQQIPFNRADLAKCSKKAEQYALVKIGPVNN